MAQSMNLSTVDRRSGGVVSQGTTIGDMPRVLVEGTTENVVYQLIVFQGFISQFGINRHRSAFLDGQIFGREHSEEMLQTLDILREMVLPSPVKIISGHRSTVALSGVAFFMELLKKSPERPIDCEGKPLPILKSYVEWSSYLGALSASDYWSSLSVEAQGAPQGTAASARRSRSLNENQVENRSLCGKLFMSADGIASQPAGRQDPELGIRDLHLNVKADGMGKLEGVPLTMESSRRSAVQLENSRDTSRREEGNRIRQPAVYSRKKTSRSSESGSSKSSGDSDSSEKSRQPLGRGPKKNLELMLEKWRPYREVVEPGVFDGRDGSSMKEFLREYEAYFNDKYDGNERQQAKKLGDFLRGPCRSAYEAMDGSKLKYSLLKYRLLEWFKGERQSQRSRSEAEFEKAKMMPNDTYGIFALRLERLAEKAFPKSVKEQERQLCRKFRREVPAPFGRILTDGERNLSLLGRKPKLTWSAILQMASSEDRIARDQPVIPVEDVAADVWVSRPASREILHQSANRPPSGRPRRDNSAAYPVKEVLSKHRSPPRFGRPTRATLLNCNWCGKRGHSELGCWIKLGLCTICGARDHARDSCPKYEPRQSFTPVCPRCGGGHLGKDCSQKLND